MPSCVHTPARTTISLKFFLSQVAKQLSIIGDEIEFGQVTSNGQVLQPGGRRPAIVELLRKVVTSFNLKHGAFVVLCAGLVCRANIILQKM